MILDLTSTDLWEAVICQESIVHTPDRPQVFREVLRVLRPGGRFAFSDILTGTKADLAKVEAAFERLGASAGASIEDYRAMAIEAGFEEPAIDKRWHGIKTHDDKLAARLESPVPGLSPHAAPAISNSITRWRNAMADRSITWACFVARKPA